MTMTTLPQVADDDEDAAIEASLDRVLGKSYLAKPKQSAELLNVSIATYWRGVRAGLIEVVPLGDGHASPRPTLRRLMKHGLGSMTGKSAA
jgi:hypothetical protein